ncbi:MAG: ATP-binding protein [Pseudomonadota bacterium]
MRLTLTHKLILAFLGLTLIVLIATLGLARWSFNKGFVDYVNAIEYVRLERLAEALTAEYRESGESWNTLSEAMFAQMIRSHAPPPGARSGRGRPPGQRAPSERDRSYEPGKPLPAERGARTEAGPQAPSTTRTPHDDRSRKRARDGGPRAPRLPTALFVNNVLMAGDPRADQPDAIRVPVMYNGSQIGLLLTVPRRSLVSVQETAFSSQQSRASWAIGAVSLGLALLVSTLLARRLLAPVHRMKQDVAQLSNGDYTIRLDEPRTDELGELAHNIDRLAATLDEARSARQRFFADVSHELRTPITVLAGELEALRDGIRSFDHEQIESLAQEVERMRLLVDDLYDLSLSDMGGLKYAFARVDLRDVIETCHDAIKGRAAQQSIVVTVHAEPLTVQADRLRLVQLIQNVLGNSLAYTDSPGRIDIRVFKLEHDAVIEIDDSAPGIGKMDPSQLFEPLYRGEASRNRRYGGAGLGLSICRNIVQAHSGTLTAEASELGGLRIRITLPEQP